MFEQLMCQGICKLYFSNQVPRGQDELLMTQGEMTSLFVIVNDDNEDDDDNNKNGHHLENT